MNHPTNNPKVTRSISIHADIWFKVDEILCRRWRSDRSNAIQRIIVEWMQDHPDQLEVPSHTQINIWGQKNG